MAEKPNYYGIIPAKVRYAKINPMARLIYCEITALSNVRGYCHAGNKYFADCFEISPETVSRCISTLSEHNFIRIEYDTKGAKVIERRIFALVDPLTKTSTVDENVNHAVDESVNRTVDENVKENITSINITRENRENQESSHPKTNKIENENTTLQKNKFTPDEIKNIDYIKDKFNILKKLFISTFKKYKPGEKSPPSTHAEFTQFQLLYRRALYDRRDIAADFETHCINYFFSDADFVIQQKYSFAFFLKHFEKFSEKQMRFQKPEEIPETENGVKYKTRDDTAKAHEEFLKYKARMESQQHAANT